MAEQGLKVDLDALTGYASAVTGLASEVGTVGTGTLNGTTTLPGDCFGKIGSEVGLNAAFAAAAQAQLDALKAASTGLSGLGTAVSKARDAYIAQEEAHAASLNKAARA
ncbi:type VII secretion target [Lentzea sp. BCCO 10_0856]|uniref:Type VII secretion target n=1 Tax=Lentzea miocenica TaxID=3095431 RepID=A0ABU4T2X5_9PSEU|nr:type VII secretion target [Lentzea sp. BCCO 10_0856]MDX8032504.1 type VII secretion target [Lentzea sp. BCCO 10_0856]